MKKRNIVVSLTNHDRDIIAWLNLLCIHHQSPHMWIDAMIIADKNGKKVFAGDVLLSETNSKRKINGFELEMFGEPLGSTQRRKPSRTIRGINNEYIPGSQLVLQTRRPIVIRYIDELKGREVRISPYIKKLIRSNIHIIYNNVETKSPDDSQMREILNEYDVLHRKQDERNEQQNLATPIPMKSTRQSIRSDEPGNSRSIEQPQQYQKRTSAQLKKNPLLEYIS